MSDDHQMIKFEFNSRWNKKASEKSHLVRFLFFSEAFTFFKKQQLFQGRICFFGKGSAFKALASPKKELASPKRNSWSTYFKKRGRAEGWAFSLKILNTAQCVWHRHLLFFIMESSELKNRISKKKYPCEAFWGLPFILHSWLHFCFWSHEINTSMLWTILLKVYLPSKLHISVTTFARVKFESINCVRHSSSSLRKE